MYINDLCMAILRFLCSTFSLFFIFFIFHFLCSSYSLFFIFFFLRFLCSSFSLFFIFFIFHFLCSSYSLFFIFFVLRILCSSFSFFFVFFVLRFLCSLLLLPILEISFIHQSYRLGNLDGKLVNCYNACAGHESPKIRTVPGSFSWGFRA